MNSLDKVILHIMYVPNFENIIDTNTHEYRPLDYTMDVRYLFNKNKNKQRNTIQ